MPSPLPLPTVADMLTTYGDAIRGVKDKRADTRRGSIYEVPGGAAALLWTRQAQRDRDMFRSVCFDTAESADLTNLVQQRFGITRVLDAFGTGTMVLARPNGNGGPGTFWTGSRVSVTGLMSDAKTYAVAADTPVQASALQATVPIRATTLGPGTAISVQGNAFPIRLDDPLWDPLWSVQSLQCADGTTFEDAQTFRARVRQTRRVNRRGYLDALVLAVRNAGAANAAFFESYWGSDPASFTTDAGVNACYVADAGFSASTTLLTSCVLALESARVLGAGFVVLPMASAFLTVVMTVALVDSPGNFDTSSLTQAIRGALVAYFKGRANGFTYKIDALRAAASVNRAIQSVSFRQPASDVVLTAGQWPAVLTRYSLRPTDIQIAFTGPN